MFTLSFNTSIILATFLLFILILSNFNLIFKKKEIKPFVESEDSLFFKLKISSLFLGFLGFYLFELFLRLEQTTSIITIPTRMLQSFVCISIAYTLFSLYELIFLTKTFNLSYKIIKYLVLLSLSLFLISLNFFPSNSTIFPIYLILYYFKFIFIAFGLFVSLSILKKQQEETSVFFKASLKTIASMLLYIFLANMLGLINTNTTLDIPYIINLTISIYSLFFIYHLTFRNESELSLYLSPFAHISKTITFKMMLSMTIIIIASLEMVNYATLQIVRSELVLSKNTFFKQKTEEASKMIENLYLDKFTVFQNFLSNYSGDAQPYFLGLSIFNKMSEIKELNKIIILNQEGLPIVEITPQKINFSSQEKSEKYQKNIKNIALLERNFSFDEETIQLEITSVLKDKNNDFKYYLIGFFDPLALYYNFQKLTFEPGGEVILLTSLHTPVFPSQTQRTLQEEFVQGQFYELLTNDKTSNLKILVRQPNRHAFSGLQKAQYNSFLFTTISILLFIVIAFFYLKIIENPIKKLQQGAKMIGKGRLDHRIIIKEKNEFSELAETFNNMAENLQILEKEKLKQEQILSVSRMSVSLNHEINNPVASIQMGCQLLEKLTTTLKQKAPKELTETLETIKKTSQTITLETERISKLLKDIQKINEPIIEQYVDGTEMIKVKFD